MGTVLTSNEKFEIVREGRVHRLIVRGVCYEDENTYSCVVGDTQSVATISVAGMVVLLPCDL